MDAQMEEIQGIDDEDSRRRAEFRPGKAMASPSVECGHPLSAEEFHGRVGAAKGID
jgi:hypothetical protein